MSIRKFINYDHLLISFGCLLKFVLTNLFAAVTSHLVTERLAYYFISIKSNEVYLAFLLGLVLPLVLLCTAAAVVEP